uniref:39S ribosomal protein L46, mitochondrial n=1 Tax=Lygus hesperus TaxID=30085 RepID=A0A0A9XFT3_LYGHE
MYTRSLLKPQEEVVLEEHTTEDDRKDDLQSIYRHVREPMYLLFQTKVTNPETGAEEIECRFPYGDWREKETLRDVVNRVLFYYCGNNFTYHLLGNAPVAYHPTPMDKHVAQEYPQATEYRDFYMHTIYLGGEIDIEEDSDV